MTTNPVPSLEEFLALPAEEVARVAPATLVYAVGGTRRSAVLAGMSTKHDDYAHWLRNRMMACIELFFKLGVRHVFTTAIRPGQVAEVGEYRERLISWNDWGLAGPDALADYQRLGWRVRLLGAEDLPELQPAAARLIEATDASSQQHLWWYVVPEAGMPWKWILDAALRTQARTREDLIRAVYGVDVPLATLYLGFGKLMIAPDICPPLIAGEMQGYWPQRPGYELDETMVRRIFYDYAYLRRTWSAQRRGRYEDVEQQRAVWSTDAIIGIGRRLGDFWYPSAFPDPPM